MVLGFGPVASGLLLVEQRSHSVAGDVKSCFVDKSVGFTENACNAAKVVAGTSTRLASDAIPFNVPFIVDYHSSTYAARRVS